MSRPAALSLLIVYWLAMFTATHWPSIARAEQRAGHADKVVHFSGYAALTLLIVFAQRSRAPLIANGSRSLLARWWPILVTVAVYGAFDELTQPYFNRDADRLDWLADMLGAFTVAACCEWKLPPR